MVKRRKKGVTLNLNKIVQRRRVGNYDHCPSSPSSRICRRVSISCFKVGRIISMIVNWPVLQESFELKTRQSKQLTRLKMRERSLAVSLDGQCFQGFASRIRVLCQVVRKSHGDLHPLKVADYRQCLDGTCFTKGSLSARGRPTRPTARSSRQRRCGLRLRPGTSSADRCRGWE